jgi:hypothetical protein
LDRLRSCHTTQLGSGACIAALALTPALRHHFRSYGLTQINFLIGNDVTNL